MGSYPVPHYLKLTTLSTKYLEMNVSRAGEASILAVIMIAIFIFTITKITKSMQKMFSGSLKTA